MENIYYGNILITRLKIFIYLKMHKNVQYILQYRKKGIFIQVFTILIEISQRVHEVH